jgi:hypothetical protein
VLSRFRSYRPGHTTVVAYLALFVALGGSSYAAVTITGKNVKNRSLTAKDIKKNSLTTTEVKDRSLLGKDFKAGQLPRGATGATGPQGPKGNTGADATKLWAAVNSDGTLRTGSGVTASAASGTGYYTVDFNQAIDGCGWTGTISIFDAIGINGEISTYHYSVEANTRLRVRTSDSAGTATQKPFVVAVFC